MARSSPTIFGLCSFAALLLWSASCSDRAPQAPSPTDPSVPAVPTVSTGPTAPSISIPSEGAAALDLAPRRAIAGIPGFQTSSRVVFRSEPDKPHVLSATYLFPERVRLRLALEADQQVDRVLVYRAGSQGYLVEERSASSRALSAEEMDLLVLQTELRRALFLWPDGFEWRGDGPQRGADVAGRGKLMAQLGDDGRPRSMGSFDADGSAVESIEAITWSARGARYFPRSFDLFAQSEAVWSEEVVAVETALDFVDAFFLPPDRRGAGQPAPTVIEPMELEARDMPQRWELRIELGAAGDSSACDTARALWRGRGIELLEESILELDRQARPVACRFCAPSAASSPGDGWTLRSEGPAWSLTMTGSSAPDAALLGSIADRLRPVGAALEFEWHFSGEPPALTASRVVARPSGR